MITVMKDRRFAIVEQAGYVGEREITSYPTLREAFAHLEQHYEPDEVQELHVDIRQDWTDENGEEHQEYVY
jgi:hypothetical protein